MNTHLTNKKLVPNSTCGGKILLAVYGLLFMTIGALGLWGLNIALLLPGVGRLTVNFADDAQRLCFYSIVSGVTVGAYSVRLFWHGYRVGESSWYMVALATVLTCILGYALAYDSVLAGSTLSRYVGISMAVLAGFLELFYNVYMRLAIDYARQCNQANQQKATLCES